MSIRLRQRAVPYERDFYFILRPLITPLRDLLQVPPYPTRAPGSTLPVLQTNAGEPQCASFTNAHLIRCLTPFHEAIVSPFPLSDFLPSFITFSPLRPYTLTATLTSCRIPSSRSSSSRFLASRHISACISFPPLGIFGMTRTKASAQKTKYGLHLILLYPSLTFIFILFQRLVGFDAFDAFPYRKRDPIQEVQDPILLPVEVQSDTEVAPPSKAASSKASKASNKRPRYRKFLLSYPLLWSTNFLFFLFRINDGGSSPPTWSR